MLWVPTMCWAMSLGPSPNLASLENWLLVMAGGSEIRELSMLYTRLVWNIWVRTGKACPALESTWLCECPLHCSKHCPQTAGFSLVISNLPEDPGDTWSLALCIDGGAIQGVLLNKTRQGLTLQHCPKKKTWKQKMVGTELSTKELWNPLLGLSRHFPRLTYTL